MTQVSDTRYRMVKQKGSKNQAGAVEDKQGNSQMLESLFGFKMSDLSSLDSLLRLLCRPTDPSGLGVMRMIFGLLMVFDIWQERGLSNAVEEFGDPLLCRFPLFDFLKPLPLVWMYIVYLLMFIGEVGILLGLFYRFSCVVFVVTYWYLFLLDKTSWNNHSYLFGLIGILLLLTDANRYWSLDGLLFKRKRHAHVPLWNYAILRFQIFIVYLIAGIKKMDTDWVSGYSMHSIAGHYVFAPFRLVLSQEQVSLYIVHLGGLTIDLFSGFLLLFDQTRPIAFVFLGMFHLMNSQLFSIGMFPWMMLATMPLFCHPDWPRGLLHKFPHFMKIVLPADLSLQTSQHCIYDKKSIKPDEKQKTSVSQEKSPPPISPSRYHKVMACILLSYVSTQCVLPYSHGITKGYNHWTQGLYGYSWDMMVHTWNLQHLKITYVDKETREEGYLNPKAWVLGGRWSSHPDMIKQYARCVEKRLASYNITDIELHVDVWRALNDRFQQRSVDPRVNLLEAPWNPFTQTPWILPLLVDLSDWRGKLSEIEKDIFERDSDTDVVFVADFPGLYLENYVQEELGNTSITVLKGEVLVELVDQQKNISLKEGNKMQLPTHEFHNIHTVSDTPSCYMYIFVNTTDVEFKQTVTKYEQIMNGTFKGPDEEAVRIKREVEVGPNHHLFAQYISDKERTEEEQRMSYVQKWSNFISYKYSMLTRSVKFTIGAVKSLMTGVPFEDFLNATFSEEMAKRGTQHSEQYNAY
ncbi:vitamin K-dependent gamma-carboxylase-like isoform X2 [Mercenaria mercenaria]|uniref:vitamin K-dependent gamma-carboxylase-like isoform X2 n=1 Tax=Mercenaria mercenaria TaxID=6596 RepID=UPI00234F9765|nr:vitamin K-dependent gamma-carboxylase-like isoform X2 [Mercenaria mercenaria]